MKRYLLLFILAFSAFLLSCNGEKYGVIPFESKNASLECTVNEKFDLVISKTEEGCFLMVKSPSQLEGMTFSFYKNGKMIIESDGVKIPSTKNELCGIYAMASVFDIKEDMMVSAVSENGNGNLRFQKGNDTYTLVYDKHGFIRRVKIESPLYEYDIKVHSIKVG
jgi:hypothetical protein